MKNNKYQFCVQHFCFQELICCSIIKALLTEYSTTSQSTNFGMSLDFHAKCKKAFEVSLNVYNPQKCIDSKKSLKKPEKVLKFLQC